MNKKMIGGVACLALLGLVSYFIYPDFFIKESSLSTEEETGQFEEKSKFVEAHGEVSSPA
jgi:hypothetical protein